MKKLTLAAVGLLAGAAWAADLILDTDMMTDYDDVGAIAVAHALADEGRCRIIAMGSSTRGNASVAVVELLNAFYGRPDIPVGVVKETVPGVPVFPKDHQKYADLAKSYPEWVKHMNADDAPDAVAVYRKALAAAGNRSVTMCTIGFTTNMRRLLESKSDEFSKLDGRALVAQKVAIWYAMACKHPNGKEYNSMMDPASSKYAFENWPTPIVFLDFNYGRDVFSGRLVSEREYGFRNPVKDIFKRCLPSREACANAKTWNTPAGHSSWDEVTIFAAVYCGTSEKSRFFNTERGTFKMNLDGTDEWAPDAKSRNWRLTECVGNERFNLPKWAVGNLIDELIAREPKCRRTDDAIAAFRRSTMEEDKGLFTLKRDGRMLWKFESAATAKFTELALPSGGKLPGPCPCSFVWKPAGEAKVVKRSVSRETGIDLSARFDLVYPDGTKETRSVECDPPDPNGGYIITVRSTFNPAKDVAFTRKAALPKAPASRSSALIDGKYIDFSNEETGEGVTYVQLTPAPAGRDAVSFTAKAGETIKLAYKILVHADKRVKGVLAAKPVEKLDRGLVCSITHAGTYLSWRLLPEDAKSAGFDVYRRLGGKTEKLNASPIVQTTDFLVEGFADEAAEYSVDGQNFVKASGVAGTTTTPPYKVIKLFDPNEKPSLCGVGDLDGDGRYDFVVKTPTGGTDPWDLVYTPAVTNCRLSAYNADGKHLWTREHGWNIEMGAWYSPYFVADMDGDGKAEVITKLAPLSPDYRDPDGRVQRGPEYLAILNGLTGEVIDKAPWPERAAPDPVGDYNHYASRNQIALAYLDGKTPCAIVERGTYGKMIVDAWCLKDGKMTRLWRFNNEFMPRRFRGQGDHACLCDDVDGDGCDEVIIGSLCLDQDGTVLWNTGRGHSDAHYYGDIDPQRPGMEISYVYETRQRAGGGLFVADPVTGEEIWKLPDPTFHVHGGGICSDIAPEYPGLEIYGQEVDQTGGKSTRKMTHPKSDNRWFYTANGTLLCAFTNCTYNYGNGVTAIWWDADLQREVITGGMVRDHEGAGVCRSFGGGMPLDLYGDWREEILVFEKGELRIFTTDIPAFDRRVSLMRDASYRSRIVMETSGYSQRPILEYVPSAIDPNVSIRLDRLGRNVIMDVVAPLAAPLKGVFKMEKLPEKWSSDFTEQAIDLKPGERWQKRLPINRPPNPSGRYFFKAKLVREGANDLMLTQPFWF